MILFFSRKHPSAARWFLLVAWILAAPMLTGCVTARRTTDLATLQMDLQRYSVEYAERTTAALDAYAQKVGTAAARSQAVRWKVSANSAVITIVTGPNPQVNLLDTLALATLTRMALEEIGAKLDDGPAFEPWLEVSRNLEAYAWDQLAGNFFSAAQLRELRDSLQRWWEANPAGHISFIGRPEESRSLIRRAAEGSTRPGSVFALVGLDPMAGLTPAVREVTRTRLAADRAMFMAQRMPSLLRWHVELLADDLMREKGIAEVIDKTARVTDSAERISRAVESASVRVAELPDRITAERQAILEAIKAQEGQLRELAAAVSKTLAAGESMSTSLNTTVTTFDALMERFGVGEPATASPPAGPNENPFRILDYAQTATQLEATARQLTMLFQTFDQTLGSTNLAELPAQVGAAVEQAQAGSREVVDHIFWRALFLVVAVLVAALIYRWVATRLTSASRSRLP